jgi:sRNA-binding regulator protein Hfq
MNTIFIVILLLVILIFLFFRFKNNKKFRSNVDGNYYLIRGGNGKTETYLQNSVDTLAIINKKVDKLIVYLDNTYKNDPIWKHIIEKLKENYSSDILSEAAKDMRYTTFTVDKQEMHICLRTRDNNEKVYDIDLLMYVILHELAHMCNYTPQGQPIIGHGTEFIEIFQFLVKNAIELKIYKYKDYSKEPQEYCGIMITSNVY